MKTTVFNSVHKKMGGKMVPFAGFEMPVEFSGVSKEHVHIRNKVGVFDVSHMGEIWVEGDNAGAFVQRMTSNDVQRLEPGKIQYSCFPNGRGGIVDDLLVYMFGKDKYLLVVNASNIEKDWNWLVKNNDSGVDLTNASDRLCQLAVQGPDAVRTLQKLTGTDLKAIPYYTFITGEMAGLKDVIISNTGYTGAGGFELYADNADGMVLMNAVMEAGEEFDIRPAGLAARDTLRLEMGFCLYGNDIDDTTSPLEAGLGWITKFVEGNDFIDREYLEKQKQEGITKRLSGFVMNERGIPRKDYPVMNEEGAEIGKVTSGTISPLTSKSIGMGYVKIPYHKQGTVIYIGIRNKQVPATVVKPPFYTPE
ncbi:MAG: glycine cleavage system aminomethyltransferase GcvT [Bacteroidales bacterium]|nr:glycine cleavage system aminomethyltransferase GcvT [Bacteroidales bacterium]